jgi:hypothetical protein
MCQQTSHIISAQIIQTHVAADQQHNFSTDNTNSCGSRPASRRAAVDVTDCAMRNASISSPLDSRGSSPIEFIFRRTAAYLQLVNHSNQIRVPTGFYRMIYKQNVSLSLLNLLLLLLFKKALKLTLKFTLRLLLHISVYDHHQGVYAGAWLKLYLC